jgi:hypothetical protein
MSGSSAIICTQPHSFPVRNFDCPQLAMPDLSGGQPAERDLQAMGRRRYFDKLRLCPQRQFAPTTTPLQFCGNRV